MNDSATVVPVDLRHTPEERAARTRGVTATIDQPCKKLPRGVFCTPSEVVMVVHTSGTTMEIPIRS